MSNIIPWVEKYRPISLDGLSSHKEIVEVLRNFISKEEFPHLLFYGPPGTGKTSLILACVQELYKDNYDDMVLELNGSNDRGIKIVRERILGFASGIALSACFNDDIPPYKIIILDEADAMTNEAQFTLRRVIEDYVENVRFCLICNYVNKIISALQSRCIKFRFGKLNKKDILNKITYIAEKENIKITSDGIQAIVDSSNGDMRKAINNLQMISMFINKEDDKKLDEKILKIEDDKDAMVNIISIGEKEVNYIMGNLSGKSLRQLIDILLSKSGKYADFDSKLTYLESILNQQIVLLQLVCNISKELVLYCKDGKIEESKLQNLLEYLSKLERKIIKCSLIEMYYGELVSVFILYA